MATEVEYDMNEARGSYNAYFLDANNNKVQFTLRQDDEQSDADFLLRVSQFTKTAAEHDFYPVSSAKTPQNDAGGVTGAIPGAVVSELESIEVENIILAAGGDHPRWSIKGGWAWFARRRWAVCSRGGIWPRGRCGRRWPRTWSWIWFWGSRWERRK